MGRIWNILGWLTIAALVPVMIYATTGESEDDYRALAHAATCKTCVHCQGGPQLPCVIDGDNLRVINPEVSAPTTKGVKVAQHLRARKG